MRDELVGNMCTYVFGECRAADAHTPARTPAHRALTYQHKYQRIRRVSGHANPLPARSCADTKSMRATSTRSAPVCHSIVNMLHVIQARERARAFVQLTHHFQADRVALAVALHVRCDARVAARLLAADALDGQVAGADDDAGLRIVLDGLALWRERTAGI